MRHFSVDSSEILGEHSQQHHNDGSGNASNVGSNNGDDGIDESIDESQNTTTPLNSRPIILRRRKLLFAALLVAYGIFDSNRAYEVTPSSPPLPTDEHSNNNSNRDSSPSLFGTSSVEVVTTNYGWNTPSSTDFSRSILSGEFFNATLAHPLYNATAWSDLESNPDPDRQIIAFLDIDTCIETNYPIYGGPNWKVNIEPSHPRPGRSAVNIVGQSCDYLKRAVNSPALTANPDSRLVVLDCGGVKKVQLQYACNNDPAVFMNNQVIVAYYCIERWNVRPFIDVGLPPPAIKSVNLTTSERDGVMACRKRKYLFSFQGKGGFGREKLMAFQNDTEMYIRIFVERTAYLKDIQKEGSSSSGGSGGGNKVEDSNNFKGIMAESTFAASPRGDLLFSYRFSEILSAGAVPVVYADGWLPPYNEHVVDWAKCAVFIPESDYDKTGEILRAIPEERRCEMQRCALDAWDRFAATRAGWVRGLVAVALSTTAFGINPLEVA